MEKSPTLIYSNEGHSGNNKYTFEVFKEPDGRYRAVTSRWNIRLNVIKDQQHYWSETKAGLRELDYPRTRQVKIFLTSEFWTEKD